MNHPNLKNTTDTKTYTNHNKKILLADDCINRLQENKQLLQQAGYCVDFANNGEQVLEKLAAGECYDLIATDVYLRDMTALQLIKHMHQNNLEPNVLILIPYQLPASMVNEFNDAGVVSIVCRDWFVSAIAEFLEDAEYLRGRVRRK